MGAPVRVVGNVLPRYGMRSNWGDNGAIIGRPHSAARTNVVVGAPLCGRLSYVPWYVGAPVRAVGECVAPLWNAVPPTMPKALASDDTRALFVAGAGLEPTTFGL